MASWSAASTASRLAQPFLVNPCLPGVLTRRKSPLYILYRLFTPGISTSWTVRHTVTIWHALVRYCGVVSGSYRPWPRPCSRQHARDSGGGLLEGSYGETLVDLSAAESDSDLS